MLQPDEQARLTWWKARASAAAGMCVEIAALPHGVAVRQSVTPEDGALVFSSEEFAAFLDGAKRGEFDHLVEIPAPRGTSSTS
ncbi:DUF397 domain-containing protein [Actinomycetospora sp. Odt1-22]|uniref:DUF397 domain-containing protein n=1 Tax=Actinomycetospora termitidis TaxID=3053470 RepID=A0ABT7MAW7_9PSEU|nr:DUF397 domain-containing protein [Actinomycetospora sp. Odt1-22]MDL5157804.1 DUF397 domain-containing protein [Actinomycetospora sp. Odt1-22]